MVQVLVLLWLTPLAIYDTLKREVPHIGWVAIPCLIAGILAVVDGKWTLALLAGSVVAASERHLLPPPRWRRIMFIVALVICITLTVLTPLEQLPGAVAVVGFWLAYEAGWWAGADALAAIALAMTWSEIRLIISFVLGHAIAILLLGRLRRLPRVTLRKLSSEELDREGAPGLPALLLTAVFSIAWQM